MLYCSLFLSLFPRMYGYTQMYSHKMKYESARGNASKPLLDSGGSRGCISQISVSVAYLE
jgi:hypothetical protein